MGREMVQKPGKAARRKAVVGADARALDEADVIGQTMLGQELAGNL